MSGLVNVYKARISVPWRQLVENGSKAQALAVAFLPTSFILLRWYSLSACNVPSPGLMWDRGWALALPLWIFEVLLFMLLLRYRKESTVVVAPRPFSAQQWQCWGTYAWHILFPSEPRGMKAKDVSVFYAAPGWAICSCSPLWPHCTWFLGHLTFYCWDRPIWFLWQTFILAVRCPARTFMFWFIPSRNLFLTH